MNLKVQYRPVDNLIPYANNARTHTDEQITKIAASIKEFGFTNPILLDGSNGVIAGHGRLLAAKKLGMATVPTIELKHLSEAQKKAYILADNRLAEVGTDWDLDLLSVELETLADLDFDLSLTGFDEDFIKQPEGLTDEDEVPEAPDDPVTVKGDLWTLGKHRLLCGDSTVATDVERLLGDVKPLLMVTDPPYGVNYDPEWRAKAGMNKNRQKMGAVARDDCVDWRKSWALFTGNVCYVWHGGLHAGEVAESLVSSGFKIRSQIIWAKDRFALSRGHYHWQHEPCWYAVRGKGDWAGDRSQSTVWNIKARDDSGHGHGTQKPVECMRRPVVNNSAPGQVVYDPFLGSGTTIIAAETEGRACFGLEIEPKYCDIIIQRWQNFVGEKATLDGKTFDEIAAERHGMGGKPKETAAHASAM